MIYSEPASITHDNPLYFLDDLSRLVYPVALDGSPLQP